MELDLDSQASVQNYIEELQSSPENNIANIQYFLSTIPPSESLSLLIIDFYTFLQQNLSEFALAQLTQQSVINNLTLFFSASALTSGSSQHVKRVRQLALELLSNTSNPEILMSLIKSPPGFISLSQSLLYPLFQQFTPFSLQNFLEQHAESLSLDILRAIAPLVSTDFLVTSDLNQLRKIAAESSAQSALQLLQDQHFSVRVAAVTQIDEFVPEILLRFTDKNASVRKAAVNACFKFLDNEDAAPKILIKALQMLSFTEKSDFQAAINLVKQAMLMKIQGSENALTVLTNLFASSLKTPFLNDSVKQIMIKFFVDLLQGQVTNLIEIYINQNQETAETVISGLMNHFIIKQQDVNHIVNIIINNDDYKIQAAKLLVQFSKSKPELFVHSKIMQNIFCHLVTSIEQEQIQSIDSTILELLSDTLFNILFHLFYLPHQELVFPYPELFQSFQSTILLNPDFLLNNLYSSISKLYFLSNKIQIDQLFGKLSRRAISLKQQIFYIYYSSTLCLFLNDFDTLYANYKQNGKTKLDQISTMKEIRNDLNDIQEYSYLIHSCYAGNLILNALAQQNSQNQQFINILLNSMFSFIVSLPQNLEVENRNFNSYLSKELDQTIQLLLQQQYREIIIVEILKSIQVLILRSPAEFSNLFNIITNTVASQYFSFESVQLQIIICLSNLIFSNSIKLNNDVTIIIKMLFSQYTKCRIYSSTIIQQLSKNPLNILQQNFQIIIQQVIASVVESQGQNPAVFDLAAQCIQFSTSEKFKDKHIEIVKGLGVDSQTEEFILKNLLIGGSKTEVDGDE